MSVLKKDVAERPIGVWSARPQMSLKTLLRHGSRLKAGKTNGLGGSWRNLRYCSFRRSKWCTVEEAGRLKYFGTTWEISALWIISLNNLISNYVFLVQKLPTAFTLTKFYTASLTSLICFLWPAPWVPRISLVDFTLHNHNLWQRWVFSQTSLFYSRIQQPRKQEQCVFCWQTLFFHKCRCCCIS